MAVMRQALATTKMAFAGLHFLILALALLAQPHATSANGGSPIGKILEMIAELQTKVMKEGEGGQKVYEEFAEWCEERSRTLSHEIKTGKAEVDEMTAAITKQVSKVSSLETKIEKLSGELSKDEADLKDAKGIRAKEREEFLAEEKELAETIETIERAVGIIEREMNGGASMVQLKGATSMLQALSVMVQASSLSTADAQRLTALMQSSSEGTEVGAPAAAAYENHSGGITETLSDMLEKAQAQLDAVRNEEAKNQQEFEVLEQSLKNEIKNANKDMKEAKEGIARAGEKKASLEGDLEVTSKDLKEDNVALSEMHHDCMTKAEEFETETKSRSEELAALAKAKEVIQETVGGAEEASYGLNQVSLLQIARSNSGLASRVGLAQYEVSRLVRDLARKHHSTELAQLAAKLGSAISTSSNAGDDPLANIRGLIQDMIQKLEGEAEADATKKAFCDKELSESREKKEDKTAEIEKLTTHIDKNSARSSELKEQVAALEKSLSELASSQAEMDKIRAEEQETYKKNKADIEQGLKGVEMALKVLKNYYAKEDKAHSASDGAGAGIIGLLETVESDFTKSLAEMTAAEESAQSAYEKETNENGVEKKTKRQDVKYKTKESTELDKTAAETQSDLSGVQEELDAVVSYLKKIEMKCIAKPETFEERKARFEAELSGLQEALRILEQEIALLQRSSDRKQLRGVGRHIATAF